MTREYQPDFGEEEAQPPDAEWIDAMFDACLDNVTGDGLEFIESLHSQWEKKGTLTPKQIQALERFYENCDP